MKGREWVCGLCGVYVAVACAVAAGAAPGEWSQWRGPGRNGVVAGGPALLDTWPTGGPVRVWTSEAKIPGSGNKDGGFGSPVVAGGRVYCAYSPNRKAMLVPRTLNENALRELGWWPTAIPAALLEKVEAARTSAERAALKPGAAVADWCRQWVQANLGETDGKAYGPFAEDRLRRGSAALPLSALEKLASIRGRTFANERELDQWLDEQQIRALVAVSLKSLFPDSKNVRDTVVVCMDAGTGRTLWKQVLEGDEWGEYGSGSTPCIQGGRCYVGGAAGWLHCLDAASGTPVWKVKTGRGETQCSPIVVGGVVVVPAGPLAGYDAADGRTVWSITNAAAGWSSPVTWENDGKTWVIVRAGKKIHCLDPVAGSLRWQVVDPSGDAHYSAGTPVVDGDRLVVPDNGGLKIYQLAPDKAEIAGKATCPMDYGASPIVINGHAYISGQRGTSCVRLTDGAVLWQDKTLVSGSYAAPVVADGKVFIQGNVAKGGYGDGSLAVMGLSPEKGTLLCRHAFKHTLCSTPAMVDGLAFCRMEGGVVCLDLRKP